MKTTDLALLSARTFAIAQASSWSRP